jgi:CheY-like chemotaxis protein
MTIPEKTTTHETIRILIVDDHPSTAETLGRALSTLGPSIEIISATNGVEALEKVKTKAVDILITDMIMPEMTGIELIERLKNHPGGTPARIYIVTAYDVPGLKITAQRLKVNEIMLKPVRPERLYRLIDTAIYELKNFTPASKNVFTPVSKRFKILIADDMPDNVTLLKRYMEYEGYDYATARDGQETVEKIYDESPDLVLLDINMPEKDGFTVLKEIREDPTLNHIPIIVFTAARLSAIDVLSGLNLGADDYITKPFDRRELFARIRTKLRIKETEDTLRQRNRELSLLPEFSRELSLYTNVNDIIQILLKRTSETFGALGAQYNVLDKKKKNIATQNVSFSTDENKDFTFALHSELINHLEYSHLGVVIQDIRKNNVWGNQISTVVCSALVVPLFGRDELLGVLTLTHEQCGFFTQEHLLLLQAIAAQSAIVIENIQLYEKIKVLS